MRRYLNALKTALMLGLLTALILTVGYGIAGQSGLIAATAVSFLFNGAAYFWSDTRALRAMAARPVSDALPHPSFDHRPDPPSPADVRLPRPPVRSPSRLADRLAAPATRPGVGIRWVPPPSTPRRTR